MTRTTITAPTVAEPPEQPVIQDRQPSTARRFAGIVLAGLTVPVSLAVAAILADSDGPVIIAAGVGALLGVGSYLLAGAQPTTSVATPLLIMVIAVVVGLIELLLWAVALLAHDVGPVGKGLAWLGILAIPVLTSVLLVRAGRRPRGGRAAG
ncbi:hypothetical protein [Microlunatus sp. Gsoil 973]|uniref:hypothetical protein n=1 Tax=Microlunatus sp. Gsoil 973 TaxID=2672569 RepID=UPI0012B4D867|nr:hypothetical protein [Microlunatus sp. Gsoil 973]QGN34781.1 hypothetical protein GJV80_20325 [Microlunatus sp. Gsoil 973]